MPKFEKKRCDWADGNELMKQYHDDEWGVPVHDDRKLFEFFVLDAFQAGLSWLTILKKRQNFRKAFDDFDFYKVAFYDEAKIAELMQNAGIIRNRMKIEATINNAQQIIRIREAYGTFDNYIWQFTHFKPIVNRFRCMDEIPSKTEVSDLMSKALKKEGFKFVGSTICYAFMQGAGMVNDHIISCPRYHEVNPEDLR